MDGSLSVQRCSNHPGREAAARCPECGRFFCRECVTEHEDRVLCSACLAAAGGSTAAARGPGIVGKTAAFLGSLTALWLLFYLLGRGLLALPSSFHEGTLWHVPLGGP